MIRVSAGVQYNQNMIGLSGLHILIISIVALLILTPKLPPLPPLREWFRLSNVTQFRISDLLAITVIVAILMLVVRFLANT